MAPIRKLRNSSAAVLLAGSVFTGLTVLAAPAAHAAVDPSSCVYSYDLSVPRESATCTAIPNPRGWYLKLGCDTPRGTTIWEKGTVAYTVGRDTSNAICPPRTELGATQLVNL
ncbi:hypothetical protein GCM10009839_19740 [Catenulispora yoronensis]|uniref:Secreted protein n=1 Tax=Catenulispora yoronensis TaxID=450799 RepID=A0ABP5FAY9_9ACTN